MSVQPPSGASKKVLIRLDRSRVEGHICCTCCTQTLRGPCTPRESLINSWLILSCVEHSEVNSVNNHQFRIFLNQVWIRIYIYSIVSNKSDKSEGHCLALENLENNICHVVNAYEMLASDVCYCACVCDGPRLGHDSMWLHPWWGIHIQFARVNAYYGKVCYEPLIARENMTRWNVTRQCVHSHVSGSEVFCTCKVHFTKRFVITTEWRVQVWYDARWHDKCMRETSFCNSGR